MSNGAKRPSTLDPPPPHGVRPPRSGERAASAPPVKPQAARLVASMRDRDRFVGFAFAAADLLIETDASGLILFTAGARCRLTQGDIASLIGTSLLEHVAPSDRKYASVLLKRVVEKTRIKPARLLFQTHDGQTFAVLLGGCRLESCPGSLFLTILLAPADRATHEKPGGGGALLDANTFTAVLGDRLIEAREKGLDSSLTLLLVDGLQTMLDDLPDGAAEEVRGGIEGYLRGISAGGDSAGQLAPDRFGIVHAADVAADEVRANVAQIVKDAGGELSGGIRSWGLDGSAGGLNTADAARAVVYTVQAFALAQGGDFTISSLEDGAQGMLSDTIERIARLRATIERRDFVVVYQPIVDIATKELHHLEALTRLEGMPSPLDFITFAEDVGLINDFDLLLCQSVLETMKAHAKEPHLPDVAINLSARTLMSPLFLKQFHAVLAPYGALSGKLLLELTETVAVTDFAALNAVLQTLRGQGFRLCLDDVGSGTTSFQSLHGLRVDYAKIDGRFVKGALSQPRDMTLLRSMVEVCQQLDLTLIGEQVEEEAHATLLQNLGVPLAQGYLYGYPSRDFGFFAKGASKLRGGGVLRR